jgi:hypothetical protein
MKESAMNARHAARLMRRSASLALAITVLASPGAAAAAHEPSGNASCMGIELAAISPPGTSDEEPAGAPQFAGEIRGLAFVLGLPPGALFSFVASLHEGSHADCDEALEE